MKPFALPLLRPNRQIPVQFLNGALVIFAVVRLCAGSDSPRDTISAPLKALEFMSLGFCPLLADEDIAADFERELLPARIGSKR